MTTTTKKATPAPKTTAAKPAAKKTTTAKTTEKKTTATKPVANKTTAAKPAAKKTTTTAKPAVKVSETTLTDSKKFSLKGLFSKGDTFKDPFEKNMVKVCAGMQKGGFVYQSYCLEHPDNDKRRKKEWIEHSYFRDLTVEKEFMICKYHVTQKQWKSVMGEGFNPSPKEHLGDDNPVTDFSEKELKDFIAKLNKLTGKKYRLPTEDEWIWAAKGANKDKDRGGWAGCDEAKDLPKYAWFDKNSDQKLHPVGKKKSNELGLYDMCGNCHEVCICTAERTSSKGTVLKKGELTGRGGAYWGAYYNCQINSGYYLFKHFSYSGIRLILDV